MLFNFTAWLFFSFTLFLLLASLKTNIKTIVLYRWLFALIALPATILAFGLLKITLSENTIIFATIDLPLVNYVTHIYIDAFRASIIFLTLVTLNILIFSATHLYFSPVLSLCSSIVFFIALSQLFSDLFFIFFWLDIGVIFFVFLSISNNVRNLSFILANNFFWLLLADFCTIIGLLLTRIDFGHTTTYLDFHNTTLLSLDPYLLLFFSCFTKLFVMHFIKKESLNYSLGISLTQLHLVLFSCLSALIILFSAKNIILNHPNLIFIISSALLLMLSSFKLLKDKINNNEHTITLFMASLSLLFFSCGYLLLSKVLVVSVILIFPLQVQQAAKRHSLLRGTNHEANVHSFDFIESLNSFMAQISTGLSNIFAHIIGPLYSNFFLLSLPKIMITLIQLPLRIFHNGSIQRSIIFIIVMVLSYYYMWELQ